MTYIRHVFVLNPSGKLAMQDNFLLCTTEARIRNMYGKMLGQVIVQFGDFFCVSEGINLRRRRQIEFDFQGKLI